MNYSRQANQNALISQYHIYTNLSQRGYSPDADNIAIADESVTDLSLFREVSDIYYLDNGVPKIAMVKTNSKLCGYGPTEDEPNPIQRLLNVQYVRFSGYGGGFYHPSEIPIDPVFKFKAYANDESFWKHRNWYILDTNRTFCIIIPGSTFSEWDTFSYAPRKADRREDWYKVKLTPETEWWDLTKPHWVNRPHLLQSQRDRLSAWNTALEQYPNF